MSGEKRQKLNQLLRQWPAGTVATIPWLEKHGVYQQLAFEYEKSGWLERVGRGAYVRAGDRATWQGALHAIQEQLDLAIHVGGKSALELKGFEHFVVGGSGAPLDLFSQSHRRLPAWLVKHEWERKLTLHHGQLFRSGENLGLSQHEVGTFALKVSSPERAMLETLSLVPKEQGFEEARLLMEGLTGLRPKLVQALLEQCTSIKTKRLFLYLADHCNHGWVAKLDLKKVDLGSGNRVIVKGGKLDPKYRITVGRESVETTRESA
jgi:hypothetical protein